MRFILFFSLLQPKHKQKMKGDTVNVRRSVRVKTKVPWMPPGKTSIRESAYKWEVWLTCFLIGWVGLRDDH